MSEWKEYKLGELTIDGKGSYGIAAPAVDYDSNKYTYLRITDINDDGTLNKSGLKSVDDKNAHKYLLQQNDIVFARTGASVGRSYFYDERDGELVYAGFLIKYSIDPTKVNPKILKFYTHSQAYYDWIQIVDNGATRGNINAQTYASMPIILPERHEQDRIVSILSSLDDKIDLLHRENATLEQMAETLFRQWFVVEAKEEWEEGKLGDEFDFTMGQSPNGDSFNEEGIGVPMYQGNADFGFRFPTRRVFTTQPTRFAEVNDTLISVRAPVGAQNMATERCCIGRGVAAFRYKSNPSYYSYTYYKLKSLLEEIRQFNDNGTVFGSISKSDFENLDIMIPDDETIEMFQKQVKVIDDKIINNNNEIQTLIQTRDGLLPRLMGGEVKL
ncbi:MAG: restriction endonuclease subunit S [Bacteroidales bacterium]|nr:restriction endonuclease subunit S [Bacteroidales bacterium]